MGFRQGAFARIWSVNDEGKYSTANITISRKNKETGEYTTEFADGYVKLVKDAHEAAKGLGLPTREEVASKRSSGVGIQISGCDVTNNYSAKDKRMYTNYVIYGFTLPDGNNGSAKSGGKQTQKTQPKGKSFEPDDSDDDDLPF